MIASVYLLATTGPFAFGLLRDSTGAWTSAMVVLAGLVVVLTVLGSIAGRPRTV